MGSPVAAVVANIFMMDFEKKALITAAYFEARLWRRYVDDVFSMVERTRTEQLLLHINNIDENICFTIERESNNQLLFPDVNVEREGERG